MGNISKCEDEMSYFIEKGLPVILVDDSEMTKIIRAIRKGEKIRGITESKKFFIIFYKFLLNFYYRIEAICWI